MCRSKILILVTTGTKFIVEPVVPVRSEKKDWQDLIRRFTKNSSKEEAVRSEYLVDKLTSKRVYVQLFKDEIVTTNKMSLITSKENTANEVRK